MWAHEKPTEPRRPVRRPSRADTTTESPDAARILALQRTVGNAAVAASIGGRQAVPVQRAGEDEEKSTAWWWQAAKREKEMSNTYGFRIGPENDDGPHFTSAMLDRIDAALRQLPRDDLRGNDELIAIELAVNPTGSASAYNYETKKVEMVRPVVRKGRRAPQWLYSLMSMDQKWQRTLMDEGAMAGYAGISEEGDQALDIAPGSRHVMAAQGNMVRWTVRHEIGHAVDQRLGWNLTLAQEPRFGGWETYGGTAGRKEVAVAILRKAELNGVTVPGANMAMTMARALDPEKVRAKLTNGELDNDVFALFQPLLPPAEFDRRTAIARAFVTKAVAQPWTLEDGGGTVIEDGDRRYHLNHDGEWVSYLIAQRESYRISNYQFSTPQEWFAEAYSVYYGKRPELLAKLHPETRRWFDERFSQADDTDQTQPA